MELPALLIEAFDGDKHLLKWTRTLLPSWQHYIGQWIMEPKSDEAKQRRADQMAERLLMTMEAELELPPMLAQPLRQTRYAMAGWERMTPNCRRTFLMAYFGARSPEARENQLVRIVDASVAKGEKLGK